MKFHLQFPVMPLPDKIGHSDHLLFTGSCFAESIGGRFRKSKFRVLINPHGILYDPFSIAGGLRDCLEGNKMNDGELFFHNGMWSSFKFHGRFSGAGKNECLDVMNASIAGAHAFLKKSSILVITFGSAFYYKHISSAAVAGNCHKLPAKEFEKQLARVEEVVETYTALIKALRSLNPALRIIFTVSPVRYIRDGVVENNRSKAVLLNAVHRLAEENSRVYYFPAYELVIDDLRDYRFYKEDLVHPNEQAQQYVFERFSEAIWSDEAKKLNERIARITAAVSHRPLHASTASHQQFLRTQMEECVLLEKQFPFLDLEAERELFSAGMLRG